MSPIESIQVEILLHVYLSTETCHRSSLTLSLLSYSFQPNGSIARGTVIQNNGYSAEGIFNIFCSGTPCTFEAICYVGDALGSGTTYSRTFGPSLSRGLTALVLLLLAVLLVHSPEL